MTKGSPLTSRLQPRVVRQKTKSQAGNQGTSTEWDTAPRGDPATGLMADWLLEGKLEGINPAPTQPID